MNWRRYSLYSAWLLSCIGMLASLYFSHVKQLEPCSLCWYQRIALFPLVFLLGLASYRGDRIIALYSLPLALTGLLFASYQTLIQEIPEWNPINICAAGPSCTEKIELIGFLTIPMLSSALFLLIAILLLICCKIAIAQKLDR